ncbi:hypothetical protein GCM10009831_29780 [Dietzia cercidiphylli]|uniref:Uncharacterized protein n=1 Tax=Dietzia cercidiphylli TaxID=498199 RepID=A0ABN2J4E2_9ACTN
MSLDASSTDRYGHSALVTGSTCGISGSLVSGGAVRIVPISGAGSVSPPHPAITPSRTTDRGARRVVAAIRMMTRIGPDPLGKVITTELRDRHSSTTDGEAPT